MKLSDVMPWVGTAITFVSSAVSENEIAQWILFGLGLLSGLLSIASSLAKLVVKWKQISEDGKITKEEFDEFAELTDNVKEELNDVGNRESDH